MTSLRRLLLVAGQDLVEMPRRPFYLLWALFLAWNGYLMSRGAWFYRSVDTSVGTQISWVNSEFQVAFVVALLGFLFLGFFAALAAGMPLLRDATYRVGELLHATPLTVREYVWGRFLAALTGLLAVVGAFVGSAMIFSHLLPDPSTPDAYAPLNPRNYLAPVAVFLLPASILTAGGAMALAARFGRAILVFLFPVTAFLFYNQFYWGWFPMGMETGTAVLFQHLDPSGFRWLKQNWLMVNRGIAFYNTTPIAYTPAFLASRLAFVGLGLAMVAWTARRVEATVHGKEGRPRKAGRFARAEERLIPKTAPSRSETVAPLGALGMQGKVPGFFRGTRAVARFELTELFSHPGLYIFLPVIFLTSFIVLQLAARGQGGVFSPAILVTSGGAAMITLIPLSFWMGFLLLFYAVGSLGRERETRVEPIYLATPVRTTSILAGKTLANAAVMLAILLAVFAAVAILIVRQPEVSLEARPFLVVWGLLFTPTFLLWIAFVTAVYSLTASRYATYGVGLVVIAATGWWATTGEMTWLTNWPLVTLFTWSDLSVFELDRTALVLNRLTVSSLAALLGLVALRTYRRRETEGRRIRPQWSGRWRLATAVLVALPAATGFLLWSHVHRSFQGDSVRERQKEYWRQNVGTWGPSANEPTLPELVHVDLDLDLEPAERAFRVEGTYRLANRTGRVLPWLPVTGGLFWEELEWSIDGRAAEPEDRAGLHLFRLEQPLGPDGELLLGFRYRGMLNPGSTRNGQPSGAFEFLLDSGVVVTARNPDFVPVVGYQPQIGVDDENRYASRIYPRSFHEGTTPGDADRSWFTHELRITAPAEYTVNSTGALAGVEEVGGRKTWRWTTDYPVRVWNVIAGRWEVKRGQGTAVFYDRRHPWNVDSMLEALDGARRHFGEWYHPYPWGELRLSEFPGIVFYARGNATNIFFSEATGFLTAPDMRMDQAFTITAHEAAHSWWGHIVGNGAGPGGIVLSEGGAHFATMMLLEEMRGPLQRQVFSRAAETQYGENRQPSTEEPLAETDYDRGFADATVIYDKGGWAFWMLMRHMGRDSFLDGVRAYFRKYHRNPDHPVIQDFVATLRPFAPDFEAYDRFVEQWFFGLEVPEYRVAAAEKRPEGNACQECPWRLEVEILNAGGGSMPVEVAATRGRRFGPEGEPSSEYRDCRTTLTPEAGRSAEVTLRCPFEPERLTVDPDVHVLQLQRRAASVRLR